MISWFCLFIASCIAIHHFGFVDGVGIACALYVLSPESGVGLLARIDGVR